MVLTWSLVIHYALSIILKLFEYFKILNNVDDVSLFSLLPVTLRLVLGVVQNMLLPKKWEVCLIVRMGKRQMKKKISVEFYKISLCNMAESIVWDLIL